MMGWKRDAYYEKLSSENLHFGIRVLSPLKKSFHKLNFLRIGGSAESFRGATSRQSEKLQTGPIQTPFEIVSGLNIAKDEVAYQVFLKSTEQGKAIFDEIKSHLLNSKPVFNLSLGTANFTASIFDVEVITSKQVNQQFANGFVLIHSAIPSHIVQQLEFNKEEYEQYNFVEEDLLPGEFIGDKNRELKKMNRLLFSTTHLPLRVRLKEAYYQLQTKDELLNIQFMDA